LEIWFSRTCWPVEDKNQVSKQTEAGGEFDSPDYPLGTIRIGRDVADEGT